MSIVNNSLNKVDDAFTRFFNWIGGGMEICPGGHDLQLKAKVLSLEPDEEYCGVEYGGACYAYDEYECSKCGIIENRYSSYTPQERKVFGKRLPDCLQF